MKIAEGLKVIEKGWVHKPGGFRVRFYRRCESGFEVIHSPPLTDAAMTSDVTAWRYAWKLWQAAGQATDADSTETLYDITVVDDADRPVPFYATGQGEVYNPRNDRATHEKTPGQDVIG